MSTWEATVCPPGPEPSAGSPQAPDFFPEGPETRAHRHLPRAAAFPLPTWMHCQQDVSFPATSSTVRVSKGTEAWSSGV